MTFLSENWDGRKPRRWIVGSLRLAARVLRRAEARTSRCGSICRDGRRSVGGFALNKLNALAIEASTRRAHLGRIDRSFGAQLLYSRVALRDDLNRRPDWFDLRLNRQSPSKRAASGTKPGFLCSWRELRHGSSDGPPSRASVLASYHSWRPH